MCIYIFIYLFLFDLKDMKYHLKSNKSRSKSVRRIYSLQSKMRVNLGDPDVNVAVSD